MKKLRTNQYYDLCLNFHTLYQERLSRNTCIHRERTKVNPIINTYIYKYYQGDIVYKEGTIGFPNTLLWRFWTAKELVFAYQQ